MQEKYYSILRHAFFWLFTFLFLFFTPVIVYYSLGYKFDIRTKKFLKTGAISIKTFPKGVSVYLNGKKLTEPAPCILRDLLPQKYSVSLEKEGFYPYQIDIELLPSLVYQIDVFLIPKIENMEKIKFDFNIYKFFMLKQFFGERIIAFTNRGIYFLDKDFKNARRLSPTVIDERAANIFEGLKESSGRIIFWNKNNIWLLNLAQSDDKKEAPAFMLYPGQEAIQEVFFGIKEKYLIIHDGLKVVALDIDNPKIYFTVLELKSLNSKIFYDPLTETIYVKDKVEPGNNFSLFKIEVMPLVYEKSQY